MNDFYTISPAGDGALLVSFGNVIDDEINKKVLQLFQKLRQHPLPGIIEAVPAYSSLAVYYNVAALYQKELTAFEVARKSMVLLLEEDSHEAFLPAGSVRLPVCYEKKFASDLEALARHKNLSVKEVIQLHLATTYRVYMIGFLPGFAYMGKADERIAMPRKKDPVTVAAGSVGIAGRQTGIYPVTAPGGWNIIGRTPVKLFDKKSPEPVLLQPGDEVTFYSITEHEFENYQGGPA